MHRIKETMSLSTAIPKKYIHHGFSFSKSQERELPGTMSRRKGNFLKITWTYINLVLTGNDFSIFIFFGFAIRLPRTVFKKIGILIV